MCQCLRYVAHTHGASLVFYSMNDAVLAKRSKEMMSHYGFGTSSPWVYISVGHFSLFIAEKFWLIFLLSVLSQYGYVWSIIESFFCFRTVSKFKAEMISIQASPLKTRTLLEIMKYRLNVVFFHSLSPHSFIFLSDFLLFYFTEILSCYAMLLIL